MTRKEASNLWPEDCPSCQMVAAHPEHLQEHPDKCFQYCPYCGKPRTERAWKELERRMGGNDGAIDL